MSPLFPPLIFPNPTIHVFLVSLASSVRCFYAEQAQTDLTPSSFSYFCREYIEGYFLNHPVHSKFINSAVLGKYWDVGGVRIEDDILVTHDGYENLTLAPKGEEMLSIINQGMEGRVVKGAK